MIAADAPANVDVIISGQVLSLRSGLIVQHKQIRLGVRQLRFVRQRAGECDALAVVTQGKASHVAVEAQHLFLIASVNGDRIKIRVRRLIIRLSHSVRREKYARAVGRPFSRSFVEATLRDLFRLRGLAGRVRRANSPNVRVRFRIDVSRPIGAVRCFCYDAHVALMLGRLAFRFTLIRLRHFPRSRVFIVGKRNGLAVRRPIRTGGPTRDIGQRLGFAAFEREQINLRRLRPGFFLDGSQESEAFPIGRPSRRGVARARGKLPWRAAADRHDPQSRVVAIRLLVDPDFDEDYSRAVR